MTVSSRAVDACDGAVLPEASEEGSDRMLFAQEFVVVVVGQAGDKHSGLASTIPVHPHLINPEKYGSPFRLEV